MADWIQRIEGEPFLGGLSITILALGAICAASLVWLLSRSIWEAYINRLRSRFWDGLGRQLVAAIDDQRAQARWLEQAKEHRPEVLRHCLNQYMTRTSGMYREGLAHLYRQLGLLDEDLKQLRSARWKRRMYALRRLAAVVTPEHRADIMRLAGEGGEIRLLVAQIIGRIGNADDVHRLLVDWRITSRLTEYPVHVMVGIMRPDEMRRLLMRWRQIPSVEIQRIVLVAASKRVPSACWELLPNAARHRALEVRIAACRAAARMTSEFTMNLLIELAGDDAWEVRAQAVKALASHRGDRSGDTLVERLADQSFWVRQNAATSLGQHGESGIRRLRGVMADSYDRYARDAAEHVLMDLNLMERPDDAKVEAA